MKTTFARSGLTSAYGRTSARDEHLASQEMPALAPLEALDAGWVFDGELVALNDHDGHLSRTSLPSAAPSSAATWRPRSATLRRV